MVTTVEDVLLLALPCDEQGVWTCVVTSFVVSSDAVRLTSIASTDAGRIFLGGDDGCLYEFVYEDTSLADRTTSIQDQLESFYDEAKELPAVVTEHTGKRSWWQSFAKASSSDPPHKCRKLNRSRKPSGWLLSSSGIGQFSEIGRVQQIVVDEERQTLSVLTSTGMLQVYDLREKDTTNVVASCLLPKTTQLYLEVVARGQMTPPTTKGTTGQLRFPGGGSAAQAGVGGMNGARTLLKAIDMTTQARQSATPSILKPAKLHVISCRESAHLTLMVVTHGGLRLYISTLDKNNLNTGAVHAPSRHSNSKSTLAPGDIILCYVRAPPSLQEQGLVAKPCTSELTSWKVDASYHEHGLFLLAIEEASGKGNNSLVSTTPDFVQRVVPEDDPTKAKVLRSSGGLAETVGIPFDNKMVPGGVVWDICKYNGDDEDESSVRDLLWHSPTPTNANDLDVPPAYCPPSTHDTSSSERRVLAQSASLRNTALNVIGHAFLNFMLSRPLSHGLAVPALANQAEGRPRAEIGNEYRVSRRTWAKGFSQTAQETPASQTTSSSVGGRTMRSPNSLSKSSSGSRLSGISPKASTGKLLTSARLQQDLLRPMTIPLSHMATQHLSAKDNDLVALNVQGIHFFGLESILSVLSKAIMSAGEQVADDVTVTSFFTSYGYAEGCAMTLALAIGCGPASGRVGYTEDLRKRAIKAAMARAHQPKLNRATESSSARDSVTMDVEPTSDSCVPTGYEFVPSKLYEGLTQLFSRLVRPVWNKPVVVVTEGRTVRMQWSQCSKTTPAKVEILLDEKTLYDVLDPLQSLQFLAKEVFKRAIEQVPGIVQRQESMMDIDEGLNRAGSSVLTQALQFQSNVRADNSGSAVELTEREREQIAHLVEERNIHSLYRLLSRVVQLLHLVSLLRKADTMVELPEVDWGMLHGLTFSQLVYSPDGQDRVETMLNKLIVASASSPAGPSYSAQAEQMARLFSENCYLYSPPASRFAYDGIRLAMEALELSTSTKRGQDRATQAAIQLCSAAKLWCSATLISGRVLRSRGNESSKEIVERALRHGSPLAKAAELLVKLGDVGAVVEICLTTAENFRSRRHVVPRRELGGLDGVFGWELDLYHKNREAAQSTTGGSRTTSGTTDSYGALVSDKDAIDTCYAVILHHMSILYTGDKHLADKMVSECASSNDQDFLEVLFIFLLENNHTDVLLRINSPAVEKWVEDRKDPELLWRYYDAQRKNFKSGQISFNRAISKDKMGIEERIQWLMRASNSLASADLRDENITNEKLFELKNQVADTLDLAKIQHRILRAFESETTSTISGEKQDLLKNTLIEATPLYQEYAAAAPFVDLCLVIFHRCKHDVAANIESHWKALVSEYLFPTSTRNSNAYEFLDNLAKEVGVEENAVSFLTGVDSADGFLFENGGWVHPLESKVKSLGHELYGTGADYTFPVEFLLGFLESLRKAHPNLLPSGWSLVVLAEAGVPFMKLLEIFTVLLQRDESFVTGGQDGNSIQDGLSAQLKLLDFWVASCGLAGDGQANPAKQELSQANATGELSIYFTALRNRIMALPVGSGSLLEALEKVEETIDYLR